MPPYQSVEVRFWDKVAKRGPDECWMWQGATQHAGYGVFGPCDQRTATRKYGRTNVRAHRFVLELMGTPAPKGAVVMHSCDTPGCVNPAHLSIGTHADNMRDMTAKGRRLGARNPNARLTEADVRAIRESTDARGTLARRYRVTTATISDVRARRSWATLD